MRTAEMTTNGGNNEKKPIDANHTLRDVIEAAGVVDAPDWFSTIEIAHWPFDHQLNAVKHYVRHTRMADGSEPGTGKTFPAQIHAILMASLGNKVVFTMPPKLIEQFMAEMLEFFGGIENHLKLDMLLGTGAKINKQIEQFEKTGWPDILMMSYDRYRKFNGAANRRQIGWPQWKRRVLRDYLDSAGRAVDPRSPVLSKDGLRLSDSDVKAGKGKPWKRFSYEQYWQTQDGRLIQEPIERGASAFTAEGVRINPKGKAENTEQFRLASEGYNVFFFDEAHRLCKPTSQVFKSCEAMSDKLGEDVALYLMSGTLVPTHLEDAYGVIKLINPDAYLSYQSFLRLHVIEDPTTKFFRVQGYRRLEELHEKLWAKAIRVQKKDVLTMQDPIISSIPVRLSGAHKRLYDDVVQNQFAIIGDEIISPENDSALRQTALQVVSAPNEFDPTGKLSMDNELSTACDEVIESINPEEHKIILFAHYKKTVKFLSNRYEKWNPAVVNGSTTKGWDEVQRFKEDDTCRILVINWASGGEGLNLQVASHVVFYECPTSPKDAKQGIARAYRSGQREVVNVYFFRVQGTLYDRNYRNLLKNEEVNNEVVRDKHDLLYQTLKVTRKKSGKGNVR